MGGCSHILASCNDKCVSICHADGENCGFVTSLCQDFRLWPGLYDIYLCLRPKNWSVI